MCVDQNKSPPPQGNFDVYRFDLPKLTPPAKISRVQTVTLHILDLTKKTPLPKFHRCKPQCYTSFIKGNFDDYRFDLTKKTPLPTKISQCKLQHYTSFINPFFALDIFICSFHKCIQHTTRGQSEFPLSKL